MAESGLKCGKTMTLQDGTGGENMMVAWNCVASKTRTRCLLCRGVRFSYLWSLLVDQIAWPMVSSMRDDDAPPPRGHYRSQMGPNFRIPLPDRKGLKCDFVLTSPPEPTCQQSGPILHAIHLRRCRCLFFPFPHCCRLFFFFTNSISCTLVVVAVISSPDQFSPLCIAVLFECANIWLILCGRIVARHQR